MLNQIIKRLEPYPAQALQPVKEGKREAAILLPLTRNVANPELVFILRAEHLNTHSGEVAFPGGMWEVDDKSLLQTALRETHEEVDLSPDFVQPFAMLSSRESRLNVKVTPYVGLIPEDVTLVPNLDELESVFRVPVAFLADPDNLKTRIFHFNETDYPLPCYEHQGYVIWGFTLFVLADLLKLVFDINLPLQELYHKVGRLRIRGVDTD